MNTLIHTSRLLTNKVFISTRLQNNFIDFQRTIGIDISAETCLQNIVEVTLFFHNH